jgi:protease I
MIEAAPGDAARRRSAMKPLDGRRFLMFVEDLYEDLELWYPKLRLIEAGALVVVAGPEAGRTYSGKHGYPCVSDRRLEAVEEPEFDGLVIPGGFAPDRLRRLPKVLDLTRRFHERGKLVAFICHAGWVPISAKIVGGRRCTSTPAIKDDLVNAGAIWVDAPLVVDGHMVTSRRVDDLPMFCEGILQVMREAVPAGE